ncbi:MAG: glycosyltransferase family 4 protein [Candidatus Saccharibacteria bacterium]|nr:glycosyltransferase family 4 protein [Rhodoferax sp.]
MAATSSDREKIKPFGSPTLRVALVGPLPPPSGGMANQCQQLMHLLSSEGLHVELVQTNCSYRINWVGRVPLLRALFRLAPYVGSLWRSAGNVHVMHLLANSGWAWHLFATPAVIVAHMRSVPIIVNYRGGGADAFFAHAPSYVLKMLARASLCVTPSVFLQRVFTQYGLASTVIPNIIDLARFSPVPPREFGSAPHLVVTRNLEAIYDVATAIRAFALIQTIYKGARLTVAGTGPELTILRALVAALNLVDAVHFSGGIENARMPDLYASADCLLNSSTVDNMPIAILEAFASGVPVVSTSAGGIPDLVAHGVNGLLVPVGDDRAMAREALRVLEHPKFAHELRQAGLQEAQKYAWPQVRAKWLDAYSHLAIKRSDL